MKYLLTLLMLCGLAYGQSKIYIRADTVQIYKEPIATASAELKLVNSTNDTLGPLVNRGNGITRFLSYRALKDSIGAGTGSVTSFSSGNLSPLFTTSVATATTTPAQTFALSNTTAYTVFGRATGTGAPSYVSLDTNYIATFSTKVRPLFSLTTTGTSGAATYNNLTGVFNIPQYDGINTLGLYGSSPNAWGGSISGSTLTLQPANAANPGGVSTTTQTFSGDKTFTGFTSFTYGTYVAIGLSTHSGEWTAGALTTFDESFKSLWNGVTVTPNFNYATNLFSGNGAVTEAASGTHGLIANTIFTRPFINNGSATTTNAATVYINGGPIGDVPANNYALWIDSSNSRFDGQILMNGGADSAATKAEARAGGGSGGETNTASNLGGGLANYSTKVGVDLRFNSFDAADFDLASNLISIDATKWLSIATAATTYKGIADSVNSTGFATQYDLKKAKDSVVALITVTPSSTNELTNKRWTARVGSTTSSATPTINTDNVDIYKLTAQTADITSFTTNLSGTPNDGDILEIQITGTGARAITWGASFVSTTVTLPATTVSTTTLTVILQYYTTSSYGNNKWHCMSYN